MKRVIVFTNGQERTCASLDDVFQFLDISYFCYRVWGYTSGRLDGMAFADGSGLDIDKRDDPVVEFYIIHAED